MLFYIMVRKGLSFEILIWHAPENLSFWVLCSLACLNVLACHCSGKWLGWELVKWNHTKFFSATCFVVMVAFLSSLYWLWDRGGVISPSEQRKETSLMERWEVLWVEISIWVWCQEGYRNAVWVGTLGLITRLITGYGFRQGTQLIVSLFY